MTTKPERGPSPFHEILDLQMQFDQFQKVQMQYLRYFQQSDGDALRRWNERANYYLDSEGEAPFTVNPNVPDGEIWFVSPDDKMQFEDACPERIACLKNLAIDPDPDKE